MAMAGTSAMNGDANRATSRSGRWRCGTPVRPGATRTPSAMWRTTRGVRRGSCRGSRTSTRATTTAPKDAALQRRPVSTDRAPGPRRPAPGPMTRPRLYWAEESDTAAEQVLTALDQVGQHRLVGREAHRRRARRRRRPRATRTPGWACPVAASTASRAANAVSATVVMSSQRRRSRRSASAPPNGASSPLGRNAAAATSPVHSGLWVRP